MMHSKNWVQYVADLPMTADPGTVWNYKSGDLHLLSAIISSACKMSTDDFAKKYLFDPLGMATVPWRADPQGVNFGWVGMEMTPRDMASFGLLYLNDGVWDGQQILPTGWVKDSTQRYQKVPKPLEPWDLYYGYTWWIDGDGPYYAAHGYGGQFIWVLPEQDMVVVITRDPTTPDSELVWPEELLRTYIVAAAT
jgi:CubicO group peptidase (beta-lactamase class C family)